MSNDNKSDAVRAGERAFKQTLREQQSDERERQAAEADTAEDGNIARLGGLRLAKEAGEREA